MVPAHEVRSTLPADSAHSQRLKLWVRGALIGIAAGLVAVFVVAAKINPYDENGAALTIGAHRQLGLPQCNFVRLFGRPCPTCGMTTSFALLIHGDVKSSLRANFAGTVFAVGLIVLVPWMAVSAALGRWLFVRAVEWWLLFAVIAAVALALGRWAVVVGVPWLFGFG